MLLTAALGLTAYAKEKAIKSVGLKVTGTVHAGTPHGDEQLEFKPVSNRYTVNSFEVLNEGASWKATDVPTFRVRLQAEDGCYFRVNAASQIHLEGAEYVSATREDNAYALVIDLKLPSLEQQASRINEAYLQGTTASWTESLGAGSYEVKLKRGNTTLGGVQMVQGQSLDVSKYMTKAGNLLLPGSRRERNEPGLPRTVGKLQRDFGERRDCGGAESKERNRGERGNLAAERRQVELPSSERRAREEQLEKNQQRVVHFRRKRQHDHRLVQGRRQLVLLR